MTTTEAIERLGSMQGQIIHGKRTFGEIADVIRLQQKIVEAWKDFAQVNMAKPKRTSQPVSPATSRFSELLAAEIEFVVWCLGYINVQKPMLPKSDRDYFDSHEVSVLTKLNDQFKSTKAQASDAELLDWMQKTKWIIEINDSKMGGHVVKQRHRKYTAPTLREALTEAMRDKL